MSRGELGQAQAPDARDHVEAEQAAVGGFAAGAHCPRQDLLAPPLEEVAHPPPAVCRRQAAVEALLLGAHLRDHLAPVVAEDGLLPAVAVGPVAELDPTLPASVAPLANRSVAPSSTLRHCFVLPPCSRLSSRLRARTRRAAVQLAASLASRSACRNASSSSRTLVAGAGEPAALLFSSRRCRYFA
ncbi:MAG TPA: hypothetical protein VK217_02080 [Acidimicrobiales bacterium]|nr:hypothetical protein [Acidimicrobiales bacterium]